MKVLNKLIFVIASAILVVSVVAVFFFRNSYMRFEAPGVYIYSIARVLEYVSFAVLWLSHFYMLFKQKDKKKEEEPVEAVEE